MVFSIIVLYLFPARSISVFFFVLIQVSIQALDTLRICSIWVKLNWDSSRGSSWPLSYEMVTGFFGAASLVVLYCLRVCWQFCLNERTQQLCPLGLCYILYPQNLSGCPSRSQSTNLGILDTSLFHTGRKQLLERCLIYISFDKHWIWPCPYFWYL